MTPEKPVPNLDNLIRRYESGASMKELADEAGIGAPALARRFRNAGVKVRGKAEARRLKVALPEETQRIIVERYKRGDGAPALAKQLGLTTWQVYGFLKSIGQSRRSASEAKAVEWATMPEQAKAARVAAMAPAWESIRGRRIPLEEKIRAAKTRYERLLGRGEGEDELANAIKDLGLDVAQQFAIGPYNVDMAIRSSRIAVEVERPKSPTHNSSRLTSQRTKYILDQGWTVLFVFLNKAKPGSTVDVASASKDVVSVAEMLRGNESVRGKYGVIGSDRKVSPGFCSKLKDIPRIPGF